MSELAQSDRNAASMRRETCMGMGTPRTERTETDSEPGIAKLHLHDAVAGIYISIWFDRRCEANIDGLTKVGIRSR